MRPRRTCRCARWQLSGGERQRLALARPLLASFEVLVLDEPTEHVDEETARRLLDDLLATTTDRTVLLITHRDVSRQDLDRVLACVRGVWRSSNPLRGFSVWIPRNLL